MDKELHEKALDRAIETYYAGRDDMQAAIATYLKTAGLTVVPVEPTEDQITARNWRDGIVKQYKAMISAFPSPFDEVK